MVGKWDVGVATPEHLPAGRGYDSSLIYFGHENDCWNNAAIETCDQQQFTDLWEHNDRIPFPGRPATQLVNPDGCAFLHQHLDANTSCTYEDELFENRVKEI